MTIESTRIKPEHEPIIAEATMDECGDMQQSDIRIHRGGSSNTGFPFSRLRADPTVEAPSVELSLGTGNDWMSVQISAGDAKKLAQQLIASAEYVDGLSYDDYAMLSLNA